MLSTCKSEGDAGPSGIPAPAMQLLLTAVFLTGGDLFEASSGGMTQVVSPNGQQITWVATGEEHHGFVAGMLHGTRVNAGDTGVATESSSAGCKHALTICCVWASCQGQAAWQLLLQSV